MAKEASVAPKERINIVYKPATGNAQAEIELPLSGMAGALDVDLKALIPAK